MIKKIPLIKNLAVFDDFLWEKSVLDDNGNSINFEKINIIYGRNYSGKTTLSRIFRAFETGKGLEKYINPLFSLQTDDNKTITQNNIGDTQLPTIRVFNKDFVNDNLAFIVNPDESIKPFAILGDDNKKIEKEIHDLEIELGSNEKGKETGLYAKLNTASIKLEEKKKAFSELEKNIEKKKKNVAIDPKTGIKYNSDLYGDILYNTTKLEEDIAKVLLPTYIQIDIKTITALTNSLTETQKTTIFPLSTTNLLFNDFCLSTEQLIIKKIGSTGKIPELIREIALNEWAKEGYKLHKKDNRSICGFCGELISNKRWAELDQHFDEESKKLETDIDVLIAKIKKQQDELVSSIVIDEKIFYTVFQEEIIKVKSEVVSFVEKYNLCLEQLITQLNKRKEKITVDFNFNKPDDYSSDIEELINRYEVKRKESNDYSEKLSEEQKKSKEKLRLQKVYEFITTSGYIDDTKKLKELQDSFKVCEQENESINNIILKKEELIQSKKRQLNDEEKGAKRVNEYLTNYFGHEFLTLRAIENESEPEEKKIHFEIIRDGKQAFNLSEGECSLIAFCYFMAKLDDIETKGKKPIIWIDDPISSLDNNHIFFVYSLIRSEIFEAKKYEQLFISTHDLNFLKYLKRFKKREETKGYFVVHRQYKKATICIMPHYLIKYVTEFNFLFKEIYNCSLIQEENDGTHNTFYNFGNNARKFFEIYLYYKYPDHKIGDLKKMEKFFGKGAIPPLLADRINNEYSHLSGVFERGAIPIEVPEMQKTATLIIETLEKKDKEQFCALLESIGVKYADYKKSKKQPTSTTNTTEDMNLFPAEELLRDDNKGQTR